MLATSDTGDTVTRHMISSSVNFWWCGHYNYQWKTIWVYRWKDGKSFGWSTKKKKKKFCQEIRKLVEKMTRYKGSYCKSFLWVGLFHLFFCTCTVSQILKPCAPTYSETILANLPAEGTGPMESWGDHFENGCLNCTPPPKNMLASHRDKSITCVSIQAKSPSDQKHLPMADVLPARMLPDKTIAYQNLNNSNSHVMKQAKAEWKGYLSLSFSSFLASLVVLNQNGDFCSQGEIWQRLEIFLSVILEGRRDCYWHLIGRGQGCW